MKTQTIVICLTALVMCAAITLAQQTTTDTSQGNEGRGREKDTNTPEEEQLKRKEAEQVFESLSPSCKNGTTTLITGYKTMAEVCDRVKSNRDTLKESNCSRKEFKTLKKAVC